MNTKTQRDARPLRMGWLAGTVGSLLLISLGLELVAHQMFGQTDVATFLLALYLAFWLSLLGMVGFVVLSLAWLLTSERPRTNRTADHDDHQWPRPAVISVAQSRPAAASDDFHESRDFNRVAQENRAAAINKRSRRYERVN